MSESLFRMLTVFGSAIASRRPFCSRPWRSSRSAYVGIGGHLYGPPALQKTATTRSASAVYAFDARTRQHARRHYDAVEKPALDVFAAGTLQ